MGRTANAAWEAVLSTVAGIGIGYGLDLWLGTSPWLLLGFLLLGCVAGFRRLLALSQAANRPASPPGDDADGSGG
jgi:ATP synthase protein I